MFLAWSAARAVSTRGVPNDPAVMRLARAIRELPPNQEEIGKAAQVVAPEMLVPASQWLVDAVSETRNHMVRARGQMQLESGADKQLEKLDQAINVVANVVLPTLIENQARLAAEIAIYLASPVEEEAATGGGGGGGGSPARPAGASRRSPMRGNQAMRDSLRLRFLICVQNTLQAVQVARESGAGASIDEQRVLQATNGSQKAGQNDVDNTNRPPPGGSPGQGGRSGGPDPGDPSNRPPETSPSG